MTPLQLKALDHIREQLVTLGYAPTVRSLARGLDVGLGAAHRAISGLVEQGKLTRMPGKIRGLQISGTPDLRLVDTDALEAELGRRGVTFRALSRIEALPFAAGPSCAADTCGTPVQRGHLMCRRHWLSLPLGLQREILDANARRDSERFEQAVTRARDLIDGCGDGLRRRA